MNPEEYSRMFEAEERQWWYAGMRAISLALLSPALPARGEPLRILDAGCGTGNNLRHLSRHGRAVGVDISDDALRFCRARGVAAAKASLLALPFPDAAFDCITSFDVLYHRWVEDDRAAVGEMARVLRPGGVLLVRVPALRALWGAHDEAVHSRHRYTRREVKGLLQGAGLEVVRAVYGNSLLFPLVAARRTLDRITGRHGSDVSFLPAPFEWAFRSLLEMEARLVRRVSFPVGASVFALARRPRAAGAAGPPGYNSPMETPPGGSGGAGEPPQPKSEREFTSREREDRERRRVAEELRRVRDAVRDRALLEPDPRSALPPPAPVRTPEKVPPLPAPSPPDTPPRPDNAALNAMWRILDAPRRSLRDLLRRFQPRGVDAASALQRQQDFNSRQVQFDNELLAYVEARLDATHRHYDRILGLHADHMGEIDERHLILQEELVAHVHDLVKRIDLVLGQAEGGRLGLESALKDLRARVVDLEQRLRRG